MTLKIAVIIDGNAVQRFALDALDAVTGADQVTVFSCTNTRFKRRWFKHGAYYAINLLTVRNRLSKYVPIASGRKRITRTIAFQSGYERAWQTLPAAIVEQLRSFDIVLKFGMGLLRVPGDDALSVPILSYHHGDPDQYRGRPAGFWEMNDGTRVMGQVVQIIGDKLDAGKVVAFAETKVFPWSYKATLIEAYRRSPLIINTAINNAISGAYIDKASNGRNCRLPSNGAVLAFSFRVIGQAVRRLIYGALREKAWEVSTATAPGMPTADLPEPENWANISRAPAYQFYADPFFAGEAILVEALRKDSGLGEIVRIDGDSMRTLISGSGHMSYPATVTIAGIEVIIPEIASWSSPRIYSTAGEQTGSLRIAGETRISDPTLFERDERIYLFGNERALGSNVLNLWSAPSLHDTFELHPASPIRISPEGSRMGGNLIERSGRLFRLGQDFSGGYGDGLIIFEINALNQKAYAETKVGEIRFADRKGPHTLNVRGDEVVFDWYRDRLSPLAGIRRLRSALQRRRPHATQ